MAEIRLLNSGHLSRLAARNVNRGLQGFFSYLSIAPPNPHYPKGFRVRMGDHGDRLSGTYPLLKIDSHHL
jgi:hypothetical protein